MKPKAFYATCDQLAAGDPDLAIILGRYDYPPFWSRPNSFESLAHIILEQQVSLASARAALEKLRQATGTVTPEAVLRLNDEALRAAYVSRQKSRYLRELARALTGGRLDLHGLGQRSDDDVRHALTALPGIGNWTTDIYLIMVLHRPDIFPAGDLAALKALRRLKGLDAGVPVSELCHIAARWQPHRSAATMLLWHYYLSE